MVALALEIAVFVTQIVFAVVNTPESLFAAALSAILAALYLLEYVVFGCGLLVMPWTLLVTFLDVIERKMRPRTALLTLAGLVFYSAAFLHWVLIMTTVR